MRLSTSQIFRQSIGGILDRQLQLNQTQLQISTGKRIARPSDDPVGAARILDIKEQMATVNQYQRNADLANTQLNLEENALNGVENVLQRVRELALQAKNDTLDTQNRQGLASEIRARVNELLSLVNTKDANGDFMFAGFQTNTQPFVFSGGTLSYNGDQGQRFLQIGPSVQIAASDSGASVFQDIGTGNGTFSVAHNPANTGTAIVGSTATDGSFVPDTYTVSFTQALPTDPITYQVSGVLSGVVAAGTYGGGEIISFNGAAITIDGDPADGDSFTVASSGQQDMFTTLDKLAAALESTASGRVAKAELHNVVNRQIENLDRALDNVLATHTQVGTRLNNVDSQTQVNGDFILQMTKAQSDIEDIDLVDAIGRLSLETVALQAAQQAYVRVQSLSLFNIL